MVEHPTLNRQVVGSSPTRSTRGCIIPKSCYNSLCPLSLYTEAWCSGLTCGPVKAEIAGSNPVASAIFLLGHGAIAQLGERVNRTHEVRGSNPLSSTRVRPSETPAGWHAPVAQLDRVPDYESGGRRFESCPARDTKRGVRVVEGAALEMLCTGNRTVGSNPTLSARPGPGVPRPGRAESGCGAVW